MLVMTSVIVEKSVSVCFLTFTFYGQASQMLWFQGNFPPTLLLDRPACVNNALINALKN